MSLLRAVLSAIIAVSGLVLSVSAPAFACSCVTADPPRHVTWADVVVVGQITDITSPPGSGTVSSTDPVAYTVAVEKVLKGDVGATVEVISARDGASCGLEGIEEGGDYVVFAAHQSIEGAQTDELWASLCGGTTGASPTNVAEVEAVTGPGHAPEPDGWSGTSGVPTATTEEPAAASSALSAWVWAGGAVVLGISGLLVARRRRAAA